MAKNTTLSYVEIDWNKTKQRKAAQAEYEKARDVMRAADAKRRRVISDEMIADKLIQKGSTARFSVRPWDGVLQLVKDEGVWLFDKEGEGRKGTAKETF